MASKPRPTLSLETLSLVYQFLPNGQNRSNFEKTCLKFRNVCLEEEVNEMRNVIELENQYLNSPLCEEGVPEEIIEMVEEKIGYKLPFHLREFIKITNGTRRLNSSEQESIPVERVENIVVGPRVTTTELMKWHWSWLSPFQDWRYHSPRRVQIGIFENVVGAGASSPTLTTMSGGNGSTTTTTSFFVDLKSGWFTIEEGVKSFGMNFKEWIQSIHPSRGGGASGGSGATFRSNPFNMQKLLSNEQDLKRILKNHGYLYEFLSEEQKKNEKYINLAMKSSPILQFVPNSFKNDRNFIQLAIKCHAENYIHMNSVDDQQPSLKKDSELVRLFIERGGSLSVIPSESISNSLILLSLQMKGGGEGLDEEILRKSSSPITTTTTTDHEFLIKLVYLAKPSCCQGVGNFMRQVLEKVSDEKVLKRIFEIDPAFMIMIGLVNKNPIDKKVALQIFETKLYDSSQFTRIFSSLPKDLQTDKEVVERALLKCFDIYPTISESLKMDKHFNLQLLTKWLLNYNNQSNRTTNNSFSSFQCLKPLYEVWGNDDEFLHLAFNASPEFIIEYPKLMDETFIDSLKCCHYGKLSFGEILKSNPYEGYRLAVRRNKLHPSHDLVEAKDTLQDIRKALPKEEDPQTLDDIRQSLLSSVWYDYW